MSSGFKIYICKDKAFYVFCFGNDREHASVSVSHALYIIMTYSIHIPVVSDC